MRIGEVADRSGVSTKTIRYYEEIGVMPEPSRTANGYRKYGEQAIARIRFIRDGQASGLSLAEIGAILDMRDRGEQTCGHVLALLESHVAEIDRQIDQLQVTRHRLAKMAHRAAALDPAGCADANRCQTISPESEVPPDAVRRLHHAPAAHRHE